MVLGDVPDCSYNISVNFVKDGWVGEYANSNTWLAFPDGNMSASFFSLAGVYVTIGIESAAVDEFAVVGMLVCSIEAEMTSRSSNSCEVISISRECWREADCR